MRCSIDKIIFNLHIYYYLAKINGLNSITFNKTSVYSTCTSKLINLVVSTVLCSAIIVCHLITIVAMLQNQNKFIVEIIYVLNILLSVTHMTFIYFIQIFSHQLYLNFINQSIAVHQNFLKSLSIDNSNFFDRFFMRCYTRKILTSALQIMFLAFSYVSIARRLFLGHNFYRDALIAFLDVYSSFVRSILMSLYYCIQLLVMQYYRKVNLKLATIFDEIETNCGNEKSCRKMQIYLRISDELDTLTSVLRLVDTFLSKTIKVFGVHLLLSTMESFVNILSYVIFI